MNGQGSPNTTTWMSGKPLRLCPRPAFWCGLLVFGWTWIETTGDLTAVQTLVSQDGLRRPPTVSLAQDPSSTQDSLLPSVPLAADTVAAFSTVGAANPAEDSGTAANEQTDHVGSRNRPIHLNFTIGGDKPVRWEGQIRWRVPGSGQWKNLNLLSIDPATLGLVQLGENGQDLSIQHSTAVTYNSFQVECQANIDAEIELQLRSPDNPQWSFYQTLAIRQLLEAPWSLGLANSGHGLWIERPSEDQLILESSAKGDFFEAGETFRVLAIPNLLKIDRGASLKYHAKITDISHGDTTVWEERGEMAPDSSGEYPPLPPITVTAGPQAGVYRLQVELSLAKTALAALLPPSVTGNPIVATRQMQWIVVAGQSSGREATTPIKPVSTTTGSTIGSGDSALVEITATQLGGSLFRSFELHRLQWLPRRQSAPTSLESTYETTSSENLRTIEFDGQTWWELGAQQWRVIKFPNLEAGAYWVEVEFENAPLAQLGLDLLQTDRWGRTPHWTTGSLWSSRSDPLLGSPMLPTNAATNGRTIWRTIHWLNPLDSYPTTVLCLTNRSTETNLRIGTIRATRLQMGTTPIGHSAKSRRQVGYYLETPLLASIFAARKPNPSATSPPLNDWLSYHDASQRLVQYLKAKEYNTVWLPVVKQGGTLFPLEGFQTLPRFENSSFGAMAQRNPRLDVLELLLRQLSHEQMTLIPVLDFSVHLPEGTPRLDGRRHPLDPDLQQQVLRIVNDVVSRYHRHPAFQGIAIELNPDSPLVFRSETDGLNGVTASRFFADSGIAWPRAELGELGEASSSTIEQWVLKNQLAAWLEWRAKELTKFFTQVHHQLQVPLRPIDQPALKLHLVITNVHRQPILQESLFPSLRGRPNWIDHWLKLGLNLEHFRAIDDGILLVVQQPTRNPTELIADRRAHVTTRTPEFWQALASLSKIAFMSQQSLQNHTLEAMSKTPSDHHGQSILSYSVVSESVGCEALWAEAVRRQDVRSLLNQTGGLSRTDNASEKQFAAAYSRLIDEDYATLYQESSSPVAIRQFTSSTGVAQVYVVNAAPWPVSCRIDIAGSHDQDTLVWSNPVTSQPVRGALLQRADNRLQPAGFQRSVEASTRVTLDLAPYSLTILEGPPIEPLEVQISQSAGDANQRLQELKASLFRRLRQATSNAAPMVSIQNPDFEVDLHQTGTMENKNWVHGQLRNGQSVARDPNLAHSGQSSLRVRNSDGVVWLRSNSIPPPTTGRVSVTAWVRTNPMLPVPSIRMAIDGQSTDSRKYYRFAEIPLRAPAASTSNEEPAASEWQPIAVHFDDLPETGLTSIRVGFDLLNSGEVWIDSVQCFDRWLDANDQNVLSNRLGLAAYSLETKQNAWAAVQTMDDYWLRFLLKFIPDPSQIAESQSVTPDSSQEQRSRNAQGRRFLPLR